LFVTDADVKASGRRLIPVNNSDVAAAFTEIAELLELKNESSFRVRAYENAAKTLGSLSQDVRVLSADGGLKKVKGIGEGLAAKIDELLETGHITYLDSLRAEFPEGVRAFLSIPGVGPSLARRAYQELGVCTLEELREAAEDGRLAGLPGLGEKSAENVLHGLTRVNKRDSRISIGKAVPVVEELITSLNITPHLMNLSAAGSLRRWVPTIGDIDLMATSDHPDEVMQTFTLLPQVARVLARGQTKSSILTDNGLQVDLRIVEQEHFGSLLQHFTGSKAHNIELREYALRLGLSLNEYGIASVATGERTPFADEVAFYRALGLEYIPPELREGSDEIEASRTGTLPNLVQLSDIKGDLHAHTEWSDGSVPIRDMIMAARDRGYEYLAITDHSAGIGVAGGLSTERLLEQIASVREINSRIDGIHALTGSEVDIRRDGSLDFPDDVLAQLDWVIASVHSGFNQSEAEMTARVIRAIENPHVDAIAHPTGRLIGKREPYAVDLDAIFKAAARTNTALEINSFPERLDLSDTQARRALELGVLLVVDTDAHAPIHFANIRYGTAMARRAWAEPRNILNTFTLSELNAWLSRDVPSP
jgi:DNA polymerase (family X)